MSALHRFARSQSGSIGLIFALAGSVALLTVGTAIDYSRLSEARAKLQSAVDAATQAATVQTGSDDQKLDAFRKSLAGNLGAGGQYTDLHSKLDVSHGGTTLTGSVSASIHLTIMRITGMSNSVVSASSTMETGTIDVEFALALDVSGSMRASMTSGEARIDALKTAARTLVDTVSKTISPGSSAKFGVVPFTMNVNIGTDNAKYVKDTADPLFAGTTWAGCVFERAPPYNNSRDYDGSESSPRGKWNAYVQPPEPNSGGTCTNPSNGTNTGYAKVDPLSPTNFSPFIKGPNFNCVRHAMLPLTSSAANVTTKIDSLTAEYNNGTIIAPGVAWALRILTPDAPFTGAQPFTGAVRKIIVVLTDGEQTTEFGSSSCSGATNSGPAYQFKPSDYGLGGKSISVRGPRDYLSAYGYLYDSDPFNKNYSNYAQTDPSTDDLSRDACATAKREQGVEVYAIAVSSAAGPGTRAYNMLSACATDTSHFFYVEDKTAMVEAFNKIAKNSTVPRRTQ